MKVNLHTHTPRCGHAVGAEEDYVLAALDAGYDVLGFSDHTPFPYPDGYDNTDKMDISQLEDYISCVLAVKEKYAGRIEIRLGLECEPIPEFFPFLKEMRERMDYLILGNHGDKRSEPFFGRANTLQQLESYYRQAVVGMETGLFLYLAHPDLVLNAMEEFTPEAKQISRELCRQCKKMGIPVEYNLNGLYRHKGTGLGYPYEPFWQIAAEEGCTAVVGVDAHDPRNLIDYDLDAAAVHLKQLGLTVLDDPMNVNNHKK